MKKKLLFFTFTLIIAVATIHGQPSIKIFAYEQQSLPGTIPVGAKDENGNPIKKAAAKTNYFIFLSFNKNHIIRPVQVIIKGSPFTVDTFTNVDKTPIEYTNRTIPKDPHKMILVPKTSNKVIKIEPVKSAEPPGTSTHIKSLVKANALVIIYYWKNKKYSIALKKITELDPEQHE